MSEHDQRSPAPDPQGFTLVEMVIVVLILGLIAGIVVFAVGNTTTNAATNACRSEAKVFTTAVLSYYAKQEPKAWPPDGGASPSVQTVADALKIDQDLSGSALAYLDGSQKAPADASKGWTYDFVNHSTADGNCP